MSIILNHKSNQYSSLQQCILTFFFTHSDASKYFLNICIFGKVLNYAGSSNLQRKNIYHHSGIHKLPNWRNIHQILVNWKNRMEVIRCYMTAIINKEGKEKHKKTQISYVVLYIGNSSLNKFSLIGNLTIQKFRSHVGNSGRNKFRSQIVNSYLTLNRI